MSDHTPPTDDELAKMWEHIKAGAQNADLWHIPLPVALKYLDRCIEDNKRLRAEVESLLEELKQETQYCGC